MQRALPPTLLSLVLVLSACSASAVPFPTELPSQRKIDEAYQTLLHNLSPLPSYHFEIVIPQGWETLDTALRDEPSGTDPVDMGAFREPGPWAQDPDAPAGAEVTVTVVRASGSIIIGGGEAARVWLRAILNRTVPGYELLRERTVTVDGHPAADLLIRYGGKPDIIARFWARPSDDGTKVFVVIGSAPMEKYREHAEALYTALATFRPEVNVKVREESLKK